MAMIKKGKKINGLFVLILRRNYYYSTSNSSDASKQRQIVDYETSLKSFP